MVGMGGITRSPPRPGLQLDAPEHWAPLAEILKLNWLLHRSSSGSADEVPVWQTSSMGPVPQPAPRTAVASSSTSSGSSAERRTSVYPALYEGTTPVEPDRTPEEGYHLMAT